MFFVKVVGLLVCSVLHPSNIEVLLPLEWWEVVPLEGNENRILYIFIKIGIPKISEKNLSGSLQEGSIFDWGGGGGWGQHTQENINRSLWNSSHGTALGR